MASPVDLPSPVAIARELCGLTTALRSDVVNYERVVLEHAHRFLCEEPPNIAKARLELAGGIGHAFRQKYPEHDRPESWLVAASMLLLSQTSAAG